jgi:hypothetical protein
MAPDGNSLTAADVDAVKQELSRIPRQQPLCEFRPLADVARVCRPAARRSLSARNPDLARKLMRYIKAYSKDADSFQMELRRCDEENQVVLLMDLMRHHASRPPLRPGRRNGFLREPMLCMSLRMRNGAPAIAVRDHFRNQGRQERLKYHGNERFSVFRWYTAGFATVGAHVIQGSTRTPKVLKKPKGNKDNEIETHV